MLDRETNNAAHLIHQIHLAGATFPEILNILAVEHDSQTILNNMNTVLPGFILANINFSSNSGGKVGSIYFNGSRRVRLVHTYGPTIEHAPGAQRYTLSKSDDKRVLRNPDLLFNDKMDDNIRIYNYVITLNSWQPAVAGQGHILYEYRGHNGRDGWHYSRGRPTAFNYLPHQWQLNIICNVAQGGNNDLLRRWMKSFRALKRIPMN
jgi:hypothetical protein